MGCGGRGCWWQCEAPMYRRFCCGLDSAVDALSFVAACLSVLGSAFIIVAVRLYDRTPKVFTKVVVVLSWFTMLVIGHAL